MGADTCAVVANRVGVAVTVSPAGDTFKREGVVMMLGGAGIPPPGFCANDVRRGLLVRVWANERSNCWAAA